MKSSLFIVLIFFFCFKIEAQTKPKSVELINWSSQNCDNTFDPYRLKSRIHNIEYTDSTTIFTIQFSDNCCVKFNPVINFHKNKLVLKPYRQYEGDYCSCNCCFSISYEIVGLVGKKYQVYFKDAEVTITENYYDTVKTSYQVYKGEMINKINKYGFKEGTWIKFYASGEEEVISQYGEQSLFFDLPPIWSKGYYPSGVISFYNRKDTTESWFEDGEFKSQFIAYKFGDTTFKKGFIKYANRQMQHEYFEKFYPVLFTSKFDAEYQDSGAIFEKVYKNEFYQNGSPKFIYGNDTSFSWFENGKIESKIYENGRMQFTQDGVLLKRSFSWVEMGPKKWGDLDNTLYVQFYADGNIQEIELVRNEPTSEGVAMGERYTWAWNENMDLMEHPEQWAETYPRLKIEELKLNPRMLIGLETKSIPRKKGR